MIVEIQTLELPVIDFTTETTYQFVEDTALQYVGGGNMVANY